MSRLAVVRLFAAVLLLLAATSTIFAVEPSQPATASPVTDSATSWSAGTLIDPARGDLWAVSCPTPSFCAAVDWNGNVLTYNGSSWSTPDRIDQSVARLRALVSVSCPTPSFCAAVDWNGNVLTYNGSSWSSDRIDTGNDLLSVSCPTASFCAGVDDRGDVLIYTHGSWSAPDSIDPDSSFKSVSCPRASFCAAVDSSGNVLTYDGNSWSAPDSIDPAAEHATGLSSISCPTASFCAALDSSGNVLAYRGSSWSSPKSIDPGGQYLAQSVSCPTASFCAAVDGNGNVLTYKGSSWSPPDRIDPGGSLASVSCPNTSFCAATDGAGNVLTYRGSSWSKPYIIDRSRSLESVSCSTQSFCVAVDNAGNALVYNGSSWSSLDSVDLWRFLSSVSCPTPSFCVAVDGSGNALVYNGSSWSSPKTVDHFEDLQSVSCPTTSVCAAVDTNGNSLTYNGSSWSSPEIIDNVRDLSSVSCPTPSFCVAVDGSGNVLTYNGSSWSSHHEIVPNGDWVKSVSCPTSSFCAAVDTDGNVRTYNGSSWSSLDSVDPWGSPSSVSCPTSSFCMAVDLDGNVLTYNGSSWSPLDSIDPDSYLVSVSCPTASFCVAVDTAGYAFTYSSQSTTQLLIANISPDSGPTDGGMPVTIRGTNLSTVSSVYFGAAGVDTVNSCSSTACTVYLPAHAAGEVNVKAVTSTNQLSNDTVTFTYGAPRITVSPGFSYTFTAPIDQLSAAQTFEVTNSGTTDIELAEDDFVGSTAGDFGNASDDNVCASVLLAPKQTCPLSVVFFDPTVGVPKAELDIFDGAQKQVAAVDLGGASTGPIVTSVTEVPQMADPVLVITGSGFGDSTTNLHLHAKTQTSYFELADGSNWTAGDSSGTCDATIDEWSTTTIIVTPDVGGFLSPCPLDIGHSLSVTIKSTANAKYSVSTSTPVISTSGLAVPSVTGLSQDHGSQSGGGKLTITGTGLSDVDAVEFGPYGTTDVTPSADGTSVAVNKVPSATVAQGVSVIVTTKDGLSSSPASSCWLPNVYLTYCSDSYFYLSEQKFSYAADGAFDNTLSVGPSGESGDDETQTGSQPPEQDESDSDDSEACAGNPSLSGSLSFETQGTAEAAASGQLSAATNGLLLSAMLDSGTLDITKVETTVTLSGSTSGEVDAPILGVPCVLALYDRVTGTVGASVSLGMTLKNLAITFTGGFVNGQLVGPETKSAGSFTITCNAQPLTSSNAKSCITFQPPTGSIQGSLAVSLWLQAGPDEASLGIGPHLTFNGSADSAGTVSWGACLGLDADAEVDIDPLHLGGTAELINPQIALKGTC